MALSSPRERTLISPTRDCTPAIVGSVSGDALTRPLPTPRVPLSLQGELNCEHRYPGQGRKGTSGQPGSGGSPPPWSTGRSRCHPSRNRLQPAGLPAASVPAPCRVRVATVRHHTVARGSTSSARHPARIAQPTLLPVPPIPPVVPEALLTLHALSILGNPRRTRWQLGREHPGLSTRRRLHNGQGRSPPPGIREVVSPLTPLAARRHEGANRQELAIGSAPAPPARQPHHEVPAPRASRTTTGRPGGRPRRARPSSRRQQVCPVPGGSARWAGRQHQATGSVRPPRANPSSSRTRRARPVGRSRTRDSGPGGSPVRVRPRPPAPPAPAWPATAGGAGPSSGASGWTVPPACRTRDGQARPAASAIPSASNPFGKNGCHPASLSSSEMCASQRGRGRPLDPPSTVGGSPPPAAHGARG
jgi:hypothetical protein